MLSVFSFFFGITVLHTASAVFFYMTALFLIALFKRRNDVADIGWGIGFILIALYNLLSIGNVTVVSLIATLLVIIWGARLSLHIYKRNRGKPEDFRYQQWRQRWGRWFLIRSYLQVFLLQGFLMLLISLPLILISGLYVERTPWLVPVGVAVWLFGFTFESVADKQLARFIADPANKGKLLTTGLWRYTRHPNYFGEVTQWWGIFIIACSGLYGWITIVGPLTITFLILKVSGVPLLERSMEKNPAFAEYKRTTSEFFPFPPKK